MTGTQAETEEVWTYEGVRVGARSTRVHAWIDETGEELSFPRTGSRASVASRYKVSVRRRRGRAVCWRKGIGGTPACGARWAACSTHPTRRS
jgi:hypothetical protein